MAFPRVSDLKRFTQLSKQPFVLLAIGVVVGVINVLYGRWIALKIDQQFTSVAAAFALVCLQAILLLIAAYIVSMAVSVFALGAASRDKYLVPYTPANPRDPETYLARIGSKRSAERRVGKGRR